MKYEESVFAGYEFENLFSLETVRECNLEVHYGHVTATVPPNTRLENKK